MQTPDWTAVVTHQMPPHSPQPQPHAPAAPMGPGGAYGHQSTSAAPVPGQLPPPPDKKPSTVTAIQIILWIFSAISALAELYSMVTAFRDFTIWALLAILVTGYFTVQSLVTPIYIERGRRWAWNLTLISATIGATFGVFMVMMVVAVPEMPIYFALLAFVYTGLYITLIGLLCSRSAWLWMVLHQNVSLTQPQNSGLASGGHTRDGNERPVAYAAAQWLLWGSLVPIAITIGALGWMVHDGWLRDMVMDTVPYFPFLLTTSIAVGILVLFVAYSLGKPRLWRTTAGHFLLVVAVLLQGLFIGLLGLGEMQRDPATYPLTDVKVAWLMAAVLTLISGAMGAAAFVLSRTQRTRDWLRTHD